jgi:hypothetical protein
MAETKKRAAGRSRRKFASMLGMALAAPLVPLASTGCGTPEVLETEPLVKLAAEGSRVRLTEAEFADLRKDIQENKKSLAKVREFKVPVDTEPAFIFHAGLAQ